MSINCTDVVEALSGLLEAKGYVIHNGNAETGDTSPDESANDWWFTWTDPEGGTDIECGPTCTESLEATASAMEHWFNNASIPKE